MKNYLRADKCIGSNDRERFEAREIPRSIPFFDFRSRVIDRAGLSRSNEVIRAYPRIACILAVLAPVLTVRRGRGLDPYSIE